MRRGEGKRELCCLLSDGHNSRALLKTMFLIWASEKRKKKKKEKEENIVVNFRNNGDIYCLMVLFHIGRLFSLIILQGRDI